MYLIRSDHTISRMLLILFATSFSLLGLEVNAQPPTVTIRHVNDFGAGYDERNQTYRPEWVTAAILDPRNRPIEATADGFPGSWITETSPGFLNGRTCGLFPVRVAPPGMTAVRWTINDRFPVTGDIRVLARETRVLKPLKMVIQGQCIALNDAFAMSEEDLTFKASPSTDSLSQQRYIPPIYTARMEALGTDGQVLESASADISVPRDALLIVSVGESLASGEGNPDVRGLSGAIAF